MTGSAVAVDKDHPNAGSNRDHGSSVAVGVRVWVGVLVSPISPVSPNGRRRIGGLSVGRSVLSLPAHDGGVE